MAYIRHAIACVFLMAVVLSTAVAGTLGFGGSLARARVLHIEPSGFTPIVVFEQYGERCITFDAIESGGRQTCIQLNDPDKIVFEYTQMMVSALFVNPDPKAVLVIGLGGATLPVALHKILPDAVIDSVEIDPAMVRVAQRFFGYQTGPRQRVFVEDGREFVERAHREGGLYDIVMLDAFDVDYIPAHLMTREFLELVRGILAPGGVVVANSLTRSTMYARESATYAAVFGDFFNLRAHLGGNRVIIAAADALPDAAGLERNAKGFAGRLTPFGIDADTALARFVMQSRHDHNVTPLRDEHAMGTLLNLMHIPAIDESGHPPAIAKRQ